MKKIIALLTTTIFTIISYGQETNNLDKVLDRFDFNLELKSNHLWKGIIVSDVPIAAVDLNYSLDRNKNLKIGVWGGMGLSDNNGKHYHEINYYINYGTKRYGIGIWDVFNSTGREKGNPNNDIWNYDRKDTGHRLDLRGYVVFAENFPLRLDLVSSFFGEDRKENKDRDQKFSTNVELSYPIIDNEKINVNLFCGGAFPLNGGQSHFYGNEKHDFDIVNVGFKAAKDIPVLGYKLPVSATVMWNPSNKEARVQIATSLF